MSKPMIPDCVEDHGDASWGHPHRCWREATPEELVTSLLNTGWPFSPDEIRDRTIHPGIRLGGLHPADGDLEAAVQEWTSRSGHGLLERMEFAVAAWLGVSE